MTGRIPDSGRPLQRGIPGPVRSTEWMAENAAGSDRNRVAPVLDYSGALWARQDYPRCARRFAVLTRPARSLSRGATTGAPATKSRLPSEAVTGLVSGW